MPAAAALTLGQYVSAGGIIKAGSSFSSHGSLSTTQASAAGSREGGIPVVEHAGAGVPRVAAHGFLHVRILHLLVCVDLAEGEQHHVRSYKCDVVFGVSRSLLCLSTSYIILIRPRRYLASSMLSPRASSKAYPVLVAARSLEVFSMSAI